MSCLASFGGLPSDLTHYSGCAELPIGDTIRVIGTVVDTLYTCYILTRGGSGDAVLKKCGGVGEVCAVLRCRRFIQSTTNANKTGAAHSPLFF